MADGPGVGARYAGLVITRRRALLAAASGLGAHLVATRHAHAATAPPPIVVPLGLAIAPRGDATTGDDLLPVVDGAFLAAQLAAANEVFADHHVRFVEHVARRTLPASARRLETRGDRDALAGSMVRDVVNVFLVESLRDVDDPSRFRMGVCWRKLTDTSKRYVIVAASAAPTVLAHELGHFLGNGHVATRNNLMSYDRDGGKVFLDAGQGRTARTTARRLVAAKALASIR